MSEHGDSEHELDGEAASKAVSAAFDRARANLRGGNTDEFTRERIEAALKAPEPHITVDDGLWLLARVQKAVPIVQRDGKTRYLLGPFEDPADGPTVLMSLATAISDLCSRYEDTDCAEVGDELTYRVVEMTDAEVEALPEL